MKRGIALTLVIICVLALSACKQEDVLHLGINAEIVEMDADNQIVYVADFGEDNVFGARCAVNCRELAANGKIIYVDYATHAVSDIPFVDLTVGDKVTINAYESQLGHIADGMIAVEQIQLATQRLNIK